MRCQIVNDKEKQRNRVENLYLNEWDAARNNEYPEIWNFTQVNEINERESNVEAIKRLILQLKEFSKNVKLLV